MNNPPNLQALRQRIAQLEQTVRELCERPEGDGQLTAAQAELAACVAALQALGELGIHPKEGGVNLGHANRIDMIGLIVGGDYHYTVISEEQSYNVASLPNPYLGLRTFTAAERDIFAGREHKVQTLVKLLASDEGDRLLFIVGASGSGKSSLARAGLLPALGAQLREQGLAVETRILEHPGRAPASKLVRLLHSTLLPTELAQPAEPSNVLPAENPSSTPPLPALLLLIDQFEELFSQAEPDEARQMFDLLLDLAARPAPFLRIIATMRSDFLPQLAGDARFEHYERSKVMLHAMTVDELQEAIQRPVQVRYPDKHLEPALVARLAQEATQDAAYLPLLQVTLEDLWRGGSLRLAAYSNLAKAIQRRADAVYNYRDYDTLQQSRRTPEEQSVILSIFLNLVRVSLNDEHSDVRWRRSQTELTQGDRQRELLIADLATSRLLRTDRDEIIEDGYERVIYTVDIVHEVLLRSWPTLATAITMQRKTLRQRAHFDLALIEWRKSGYSDAHLLTGVRLAEAETLQQQKDGVFQQPDAEKFYKRSTDRRASEQEKELRLEQRAKRLFQILAAALTVLLIAAATVLFRPMLLKSEARGSGKTIFIPDQPIQFEQFEVTNARYKLCVTASVCQEPVQNLSTFYDLQHDNYPVSGIDAVQAAKFCEWIDRRLPTYFEWRSLITRHGWTSIDAQSMLERAYLSPNGGPYLTSPVEVGSRQSATPEGIYDLVGNVWEWSATPYDSLKRLPNQHPWLGTPDTVPNQLVALGSGFNMTNFSLDPSGYVTSFRDSSIGFRCVENSPHKSSLR
ncbi:MAG: hypothetical protein OHK0022_13250 [Roseiflexaceae bacterium]